MIRCWDGQDTGGQSLEEGLGSRLRGPGYKIEEEIVMSFLHG